MKEGPLPPKDLVFNPKVFNKLEGHKEGDPAYIRIDETQKRLRFNLGAIKLLGLSVEGARDPNNDPHYVHFLEFEDAWYFIVNHDEKGYKLTAEGTAGLTIYAVDAVRWLSRNVKLKEGTVGRYFIEETNYEFRACKVYEINHRFNLDKASKEV